MHTRATAEVYGIFAPLLPQAARAELEGQAAQTARKRQGIVPDLMVQCRAEPCGPLQDLLWEVKTLHYGRSTYVQAEERCRAVASRAAAVDSEYATKARQLDQRWLGVAAGTIGPVGAKLRSYGRVRGLVFGAWAEASPDVSALLDQAANFIVTRRSHGGNAAADDDDARRAVLISLRRK